MFNCNGSTFLNTSEFESYFLHCFGCLAIPIYIFGGYCILYKTPPSMASVKWSLMNFHFWSCFLDITMSLLVTPYLFLPTLGGYSLGFLRFTKLGLAEQTYLVTSIMGVVFASVVLIFEHRLYTLLPLTSFWRSIRTPWLIMDYFLATVIFIPTYLNTPDDKTAKDLFQTGPHCIPDYIDFDKVFFVSINYYLQSFTYGIMAQVYFIQVLIFAYLTNRYLSQRIDRNSSSSMIKLQKSFQKALIAQVSIPTFIVVIPVLYMGASIWQQFHFQFLNNFSVILISSHGFFSTIAMLVIHRPYRDYTRNLIRYHVFVRTSVVSRLNSIT